MGHMDLRRLFTEHPKSVGESYGEHLAHASGFGGRMMLAGVACMLHAVLPFIFVRTASRAIDELHTRMRARQGLVPSPQPVGHSQLASAGE